MPSRHFGDLIVRRRGASSPGPGQLCPGTLRSWYLPESPSVLIDIMGMNKLKKVDDDIIIINPTLV